MSMADVDPETARRRAERTARHRRRQEDGRLQQRHSPEELRRQQESSRWAAQHTQLTESRLRQHDGDEARVEHQPSLRSLLSASDAGSHDVQAEILQSIYAEGVLDGLDLDNLTTEQEEELTDRIAEAYRRRQRQRDRSRNRERRQRDSRSPNAASTGAESRSPPQIHADAVGSQQQSPRSRPPIARPHLFEQTLPDPSREQRRSASSTSERNNRTTPHVGRQNQAARSATDLSQQPSSEDSQRNNRTRLSSTGRSVTYPDTSDTREQIHRLRENSSNASVDTLTTAPLQLTTSQISESNQRHGDSRNESSTFLPAPHTTAGTESRHSVHPVMSVAAFAPEAVSNSAPPRAAPSITCSRCNRPGIEFDLHYNCPWCSGDGNFNLCLSCYRAGHGCNYWFGFGFRAFYRWQHSVSPNGRPIAYEQPPHVLTPRRYTKLRDRVEVSNDVGRDDVVTFEEGAFCESCFTFADDCYWYCNICLEGAWGFCDHCVKQGKHCTHPLLGVAHIASLRQPHYDPTKVSFVGLPHLRVESYVTLPVPTSCDVCRRPISPKNPRFHCYQCNSGGLRRMQRMLPLPRCSGQGQPG